MCIFNKKQVRNVLKVLILTFFIPFLGKAQLLKKFEIIQADSTFTIDSTGWSPKLFFGGISGLETLPDKRFLLVSDREFSSANREVQDSWMFILDSANHISSAQRFYGVQNVEAVRIKGDKLWFSFENEESTGVGYVDSTQKVSIEAEHSMITSPYTMLNRGIEGLSVANDLWYSFEAGLDSTVFVKWPDLDKSKAQVFNYPLDKRSCLSTNQQPGSSLGNGVSEIIEVPETRDKLVVMERCFNGKYAFIKLFETSLKWNTLVKQEIFDWSPDTVFNGNGLKPDNMEGMSWGETKNGKRVLYIISDDNHNPKHQRTILLTLREL